ncbi:crocetin glucosyltransferase, chloroplastic [Cinnamomum micranthum f. kanehirae]|uniref:Crocetin glucosyltransferase, chloroplastic n=1 Tax=Cinnamomum micranthum f. kanehirae TaxID=337451 RepID=A0A443P8U1_9MAGN|nr:crocetin glucosyltransferase, chloroplastic [Cinnamomum micranthum f. kanehirae]
MANLLVISFPFHGSINPTLEFSRRLARAGARVTFLTSVSAYRRIIDSPPMDGTEPTLTRKRRRIKRFKRLNQLMNPSEMPEMASEPSELALERPCIRENIILAIL